jgi:23S rRNA (adenine-N6)-dimethyltransferase
MAQRIRKRILLAQNFLKDPRTVRRLVSLAAIGPADTVYEIGPGRGIITAELAHVAANVVSIEKDPRLIKGLRDRFPALENLRIIQGDFLNFNIPDRDYKIFASIPYNQTAAIVRKLLYSTPAPSEAYLIIQKEPARKFAGLPSETLFSLLAKPVAEFRILHQLRRTDFVPIPAVDSVLFRIRRRKKPLLDREDFQHYRDFVTAGFEGWKPNLRSAYKRVLTHKQWKRLSHDLAFAVDATPTQLTFEQWMELYFRYRWLNRSTCERDK